MTALVAFTDSQVDEESNASGSFTVNGETAQIKYAYVDIWDREVLVMLTDNPVSQENVPFGGHELASEGKVRAIVITISKSTKQIARGYNALFHKTCGGQLAGIGKEAKLEITRFDDDILEARVVLDKPETRLRYTFSYDVTFKVKLAAPPPPPPVQAVVTGADTPAAKAYAAFYKALMSGELDELKDLVVKDQAADLDDEEVREFLVEERASRPKEIKILKTEVSGASATLTVEGMMGGDKATAVISLVQENGNWKVQKESWKFKIELSDC
jgi:hypothetical protein